MKMKLIPASNPRYLMIPTHSESLVTGLGFMLLTLFFLNTWPSDHHLQLQSSLAMALSTGCWLLSWLELLCQEYQTWQTLRFCLHSTTLLLVSWICQAGLLSLLEVSKEGEHLLSSRHSGVSEGEAAGDSVLLSPGSHHRDQHHPGSLDQQVSDWPVLQAG